MIWIIVACIILVIIILLFVVYHRINIPKFPFVFGLNYNQEDYQSPRVIKNFITPEEAKELIRTATPKMKKSTIRGYDTDKDVRDSKTTWLNKNSNYLIKTIFKKASSLTNKKIAQMENLQIIHYTPNQYFKSHYDQSHQNSEWNNKELIRHGGPRLYTLIIYLNDNYKGGETEFPKLNKKFKLNTGDAVLFHNLDIQEKQVHESAIHAGKPVLSGEKWLATVWVRKI